MQKSTLKIQKGKQYTPLNQSYVKRDSFYNTARWRIARRKHLESHLVCVKCGKPANTVDHSKMHHIGVDIYGKTWEDYFWDPQYFVSYCNSCHSRKTCLEDMKNKPKRLTKAEKEEMMNNW